MQYYILAFIFLVGIAFFYRVTRLCPEPNFKLMGAVNTDKLAFMIDSLAINRKKFTNSSDLSVKLIKKYIIKAHKLISLKVKSEQEILPFENWIYDNFYRLNKELNYLSANRNNINKLPNCVGVPREYELISMVIKSNEGFIDAKLLQYACNIFSNQTPLNFKEICALRYLVKYSLMEYIAIFCAKSITINKNIISGKKDATENKLNFESLNFNSYIYGFKSVLDASEQAKFEQACINNGVKSSEHINNFFMMISKYNSMMSTAITALFNLDEWLTDEFIVNQSVIAEFFNNDKYSDFFRLTSATKYLYCNNIAKKASKKRMSEIGLAREILFKSKSENCNIANFILAPPCSKKIMWLYACSYALVSIILAVISAVFIKKYLWLYIPISIPIYLCLSATIICVILRNAVKARRMPAYDIKFIDEQICQTVITVPTLVSSGMEAVSCVRHLQTIMSANPQSIFSYCLLLDFPKSGKQEGEEYDNEYKKILADLYKDMPQKERVCIIVRDRKKIEGQEKYQGWEKKRGALIELNKYILTKKENFMLRLGELKNSPKYAITLDSDTLINSCASLVEIMAHPYNSDKTIVSLCIKSSPASANKTYFSKIFCGGRGFSNYNDYSNNLEYDIFSSGNYTGKGIYKIKEFDEKLSGAFLQNRILSHDYLEGAWSNCADSNVCALDTFPKNYSQFLTRELRWLRGDWQLAPYLLLRVKNEKGEKIKNNLSLIARYHILCNMLFSLLPIASLFLILASFWASNSMVIILLAFSVPIFRAVISLRLLFYDWKQVCLEILRQFFYVALSPTLAVSYLYAISVTIYRLITQKKLLEWRVFAHADATVSFIPNAIASIIVVSTAIVFELSWIYLLLGAIFLSGLILNYCFSISAIKKQAKLPELDAMLIETAKRTFEYFNICATKKTNYLPCDNFQEYLEVGMAHRTSPTNIGMYLMGYISAYELQLISQTELNNKIENTITTVEKLEKWRGNLYNWIDVISLSTLCPKYVSTVDSGNFLACLAVASVYVTGKLQARINTLIQNTDICALMDSKRELFYIGYNAQTGNYDKNHYDLMGSESALTYLVAIGLGKASKKSWENLSREMVKYRGDALYSWTGGMFEYLMSRLFFKFTNKTLMYDSSLSVVKSQIYYAKKHNLAGYGVSECQNSALDDNGCYQYHAYGAPRLAYSNIDDTTLVAPYASFLALSYDNASVLYSARAMENVGVFGKYGFYDSYDAKSLLAQKAYMTHHQGMIMTSIANYLTNDKIIKKLQTRPEMRASSLLLAEVNCAKARKKVAITAPLKCVYSAPIKCENSETPYVNLLSSGKYKLVTDSHGGGYSYFNNRIISGFDTDGFSIFANINGKSFKLNCGEFTAESSFTQYKQSSVEFSVVCETRTLAFIDGHVTHVSFNYFKEPTKINFSSYATIILDSINGYMSHPLYSKMFIETGYEAKENFMWAKRNGEDNFIAAHFLLPYSENIEENTVKYEGNRANLFERVKNKQIAFGRVLDPVFSASFSANASSKKVIEFDVVTLVGINIQKLKSLVKLCASFGFFTRQIGASESLCKVNNIDANTKLIASKLLYGSASSINVAHIDKINMRRPIIAIKIEGINQIDALKVKLEQIKKIFEYGISFNLVILFCEKHNYYLHLTDLIRSCVVASGVEKCLNAESTFNIINSIQSEKLAEQIEKNSINIDNLAVNNLPKKENLPILTPRKNAKMEFYTLDLAMGLGGFTQDGDYCMDISNTDTPAVWCNIIADKNFGTLVSESGGGYTFGVNSREYKFTKWSNDPILDTPSESVILSEQNLEWSITKKPIKTKSNYFVRHSFGYSEFKNNYNAVESVMRQYLAMGLDTKIYDIKLINHANESRKITVRLALDLVLGDFKINTYASSRSEKISDYTFSAKNCVSGVCAYINCSNSAKYSLYNGQFSIFTEVNLLPGAEENIIFSLGAEAKIDLSKAEEYFNESVNYFKNLANVEICGDNKLKYLLKWLPYQVLCSRFNGRTGFYQSSGAYGFRDQLQDCLTLLYINPAIVRSHILECASHQFLQGDVQHWWHAPNIGVRTNISDDRLFLPYLVAQYIEFTHDYAIVAERAPFLEDVKMGESTSVYASPAQTAARASILEHCILAIDSSCKFGDDGLILMGGGDWNDAMDKVGKNGKGTSVWCSMFLYFVIQKFLPLVNDKNVRSRFNTALDVLVKAVDNAWEVDRFARAYTDDGRVIGAERSEECKIDLISQAWATISDCADLQKRKVALNTALDLLVDKENKLIKLLAPPFKNMKDIGYIADYPLGVRENGGQYTHAAVWFIISLFKSGKLEEAYELLTMINPAEHTQNIKGVNKYMLEPYVVAGDVYAGEFAGRGGWSWYTGSASWLYVCIVEHLLGIKFSGNSIRLAPNLPLSVPFLQINIKTKFGLLNIDIDNSASSGEWRLKIGQVTYNTNSFVVSAGLVGKKIVVEKSQQSQQ